jgi:ADP-ribose pyrophosphatase
MKFTPWKTVSRRVVNRFGKFLVVEVHEVELPDGRRIADWPWLISPDFVVVLARTVEGHFLCFRQTKYAVEGVTLAPVGGHIDEGEDPLTAARRELLEETGCTASEWHQLAAGVLLPNRGGGRGHLYLALNAQPVSAPHSDDLEEQELVFLNREQLEAALDQGEIKVLPWAALVSLALRFLKMEGRD